MAIVIDVTVNGGTNRPNLEPGGAGRANVPWHTFQVAIEATGEWRLRPPLTNSWRYLFGCAMGKWYKDLAGTYVLKDVAKKRTVLEVRSVSSLKGPVFYWPRAGNRGATLYDGTGTWRPSAVVQPKTWVGFAVKGGGGAGVGAEVALAAVLKLWGGNSGGCSFATSTGRLGAVAGFSGGLAFVYATGFSQASEFQGFAADGLDFALACGPKIAGVVNPKWAKVSALATKFDDGLGLVEGIVKGSNPKYQDLRAELPGIAKTISQAALIDPEVKNITVLDVPLCGGGAEAGIYYGWSSTKLLSSWG
jgi:hypothetical protein